MKQLESNNGITNPFMNHAHCTSSRASRLLDLKLRLEPLRQAAGGLTSAGLSPAAADEAPSSVTLTEAAAAAAAGTAMLAPPGHRTRLVRTPVLTAAEYLVNKGEDLVDVRGPLLAVAAVFVRRQSLHAVQRVHSLTEEHARPVVSRRRRAVSHIAIFTASMMSTTEAGTCVRLQRVAEARAASWGLADK